MRKLVTGSALAVLIALLPQSEARPPDYFGPVSTVFQMPKGEIGLASWYGIERQGMHTSSGELFDYNKLTAAHRTLPFGTTVRVTNLKTLSSTLLKINDRGPGLPSRVIDVSWAAAKQLGFLQAGLARVEVDVISYPTTCKHPSTFSRSAKAN